MVLMFLSSVEEHIFLPKTNQTEGFWPNIFWKCYPSWTPTAGGGTPLVPSPVSAHAFWPPIFSTLRRHCICDQTFV